MKGSLNEGFSETGSVKEKRGEQVEAAAAPASAQGLRRS